MYLPCDICCIYFSCDICCIYFPCEFDVSTFHVNLLFLLPGEFVVSTFHVNLLSCHKTGWTSTGSSHDEINMH